MTSCKLVDIISRLFNSSNILALWNNRAKVQKEVQIMSNYETVMVFSLKEGEEKAKGLVEKFQALIEANGTLDSVDEWGQRRLAYAINYETEGYYVLFTYAANVEFPAELDRVANITEGVLRTMIIAK